MSTNIYKGFDENFRKALAAAKAQGKHNPIIDASGKVTGTSGNLAGIMRAIGKGIVEFVEIAPGKPGPHPDGILRVRFEDGRQFETDFASFAVLREFVRNRRNLHGVPLFVDGVARGKISATNPWLHEPGLKLVKDPPGKRKRAKHTFEVQAGRLIVRDGKPFVSIGRSPETSPTSADRVPHIVAQVLNGQSKPPVGWGKCTVEPGRHIHINGRPFVFVNKTGDTSPTEADAFTHTICRIMNGGKR